MVEKHDKKLFEKVKLRRANGESTVTIRYRNASPYIVSTNQTITQEVKQVRMPKNNQVIDLVDKISEFFLDSNSVFLSKFSFCYLEGGSIVAQ